jgi:hypothetical protein
MPTAWAPITSAFIESPTMIASAALTPTRSRAAWKIAGAGLVTPSTQESTTA